MITPKKEVLGRLIQSFEILKSNFLKLVLPFLFYQFISIVLIGTILFSFFIGLIGFGSQSKMDFLEILNNPFFIIFIIFFSILFIVYLLLFIPVILGLIKSVIDITRGKEINIIENLKYGFLKIFESFKTYWYIFSYVALIPSIIFIIGGISILLGLFSYGVIFYTIGGISIVISIFYFIVSIIYRGLKSKFAIYSAVDKNKFTNENFINSINLTNNNWWRILGNLIVVGIIIMLIGWILNSIFSINNSNNFSFTNIDFNNFNMGDFAIEKFQKPQATFSSMIIGFINNIFSSIGAVFSIIFTYLLFKTLENESNNNDNNNENFEKINEDILLDGKKEINEKNIKNKKNEL